MNKAHNPVKRMLKKVSTTLFLSVLVFHINSSVVLALTPTQTQNGSVTPLPLIYGNDQEAQLQVQSVNYPTPNSSYTTFNPTPNSNLSSKKVGFFSKFKNKFNSTVNFTYSKVSSGVKSVGFWFSNTRNSFNSHPFTYLSFTGLATLAGSYLISKNRAWISNKFNSTKNFLKSKLVGKTLSFFSKAKVFLAPLAKPLKDSLINTSKTIINSVIPLSAILILQNSSFLKNTKAFRETLTTNLSSQLSNWKNATLLPWIQEKTKNKGMAMVIVGIQTTFIVSVGIGLMDIGPSVAALALTPEKTISTTINLGVNITKAEVNYSKKVVQDPNKLLEDVKAIPTATKAVATYTVTQAKDFYHEDSYYKADKLGNISSQVLDLVVGTHGVGKLSKLTKAEEVIVGTEKVVNTLKVESGLLSNTEKTISDTNKLSQVEVKSYGKVLYKGSIDLNPIISDIKSGKATARINTATGAPKYYQNLEAHPDLDYSNGNQYIEYNVYKSGAVKNNAERILVGTQKGDIFYSPDHYSSLIKFE